MQETIQELIQLYEEGNKEVSYELWTRFRPLIKKCFYKANIIGYTQEDLEQQSFILLIKTLAKFDKEQGVPFGAYYKINLLSFKYATYRKKTDLTSWSEAVDNLLYEQEDLTVDIEKEIALQSEIEKVYKQMELLKETDRQILIKFYLEWKSLKVISEELNMSYKTVEGRKGRLLTLLRLRLTQMF